MEHIGRICWPISLVEHVFWDWCLRVFNSINHLRLSPIFGIFLAIIGGAFLGLVVVYVFQIWPKRFHCFDNTRFCRIIKGFSQFCGIYRWRRWSFSTYAPGLSNLQFETQRFYYCPIPNVYLHSNCIWWRARALVLNSWPFVK